MRAWFIALVTATALFAQSSIVLSQQDELSIGRLAAVEVEKENPILNDPTVTDYITRLGGRLVARSARSDIPYTFRVVDSPEINAFALPGGYVYVNRGLIEDAASEDELAGVLAHEIAHVVLRHGAEQAARANLAQKGIGVLGQILGRGTGAAAGESAAQMVANGVFLRFTQNAERRADEVGARMLAEAGYHPRRWLPSSINLPGCSRPSLMPYSDSSPRTQLRKTGPATSQNSSRISTRSPRQSRHRATLAPF